MEGKLVGVVGDIFFAALDDVIDLPACYLKVALRKTRTVDSVKGERRKMGEGR